MTPRSRYAMTVAKKRRVQMIQRNDVRQPFSRAAFGCDGVALGTSVRPCEFIGKLPRSGIRRYTPVKAENPPSIGAQIDGFCRGERAALITHRSPNSPIVHGAVELAIHGQVGPNIRKVG